MQTITCIRSGWLCCLLMRGVYCYTCPCCVLGGRPWFIRDIGHKCGVCNGLKLKDQPTSHMLIRATNLSALINLSNQVTLKQFIIGISAIWNRLFSKVIYILKHTSLRPIWFCRLERVWKAHMYMSYATLSLAVVINCNHSVEMM